MSLIFQLQLKQQQQQIQLKPHQILFLKLAAHIRIQNNQINNENLLKRLLKSDLFFQGFFTFNFIKN